MNIIRTEEIPAMVAPAPINSVPNTATTAIMVCDDENTKRKRSPETDLKLVQYEKQVKEFTLYKKSI